MGRAEIPDDGLVGDRPIGTRTKREKAAASIAAAAQVADPKAMARLQGLPKEVLQRGAQYAKKKTANYGPVKQFRKLPKPVQQMAKDVVKDLVLKGPKDAIGTAISYVPTLMKKPHYKKVA